MAQNLWKAGYIFSKSFRVQLWAWGSNQRQQALFPGAGISAGLQTCVCVPACVIPPSLGTHRAHACRYMHAHTHKPTCVYHTHVCMYAHVYMHIFSICWKALEALHPKWQWTHFALRSWFLIHCPTQGNQGCLEKWLIAGWDRVIRSWSWDILLLESRKVL